MQNGFKEYLETYKNSLDFQNEQISSQLHVKIKCKDSILEHSEIENSNFAVIPLHICRSDSKFFDLNTLVHSGLLQLAQLIGREEQTRSLFSITRIDDIESKLLQIAYNRGYYDPFSNLDFEYSNER